MNKIFNDDAISIMDRMIANEYKVDLLITDPPYKITARGNGGNSGGMFQKKEVNNGKIFKTNDLEIEDWSPRFYNILKDNSHCYIMTNNKNITNYLKVINEMYFTISYFFFEVGSFDRSFFNLNLSIIERKLFCVSYKNITFLFC